jgi:superfamily II RNA helicase
MPIMNEWVNGTSFSKICSMTTLSEGNLIRNINHVEELLRQMSYVAKAMGNTSLEEKFNEGFLKIIFLSFQIMIHFHLKGIAKIKRDIVFGACL